MIPTMQVTLIEKNTKLWIHFLKNILNTSNPFVIFMFSIWKLNAPIM